MYLQAFILHEKGTLVYHVALRIGDGDPVENFVNPSLDGVKQSVGTYAAARMDSMTVVATASDDPTAPPKSDVEKQYFVVGKCVKKRHRTRHR